VGPEAIREAVSEAILKRTLHPSMGLTSEIAAIELDQVESVVLNGCGRRCG
jgi:hypothetical protein